MAFETFDLGRIIQTAQTIKSIHNQEADDILKRRYLETQIAGAEQEQGIRAEQLVANKQATADAKRRGAITQLGTLAQQALNSPDPKAFVQSVVGNQAYQQVFADAGVDPSRLNLDDENLVRSLQTWASLGPQASPDARLNAQTAAQNRQSQQAFTREQDARNFEQQKAIVGMQQGQQEKMAGIQHQNRLSEIEAQGANALMVAAQKANKNTAVDAAGIQKTWATYQQAKAGLLSGLEGTQTGPVAGRIPAVTTAQQIGEGAVSAMAPVLKQIFRVAGEGTFTDKDQELLLRMVPTRTDTPAARKAKIENIDNIIRAKLGITEQAQGSVVDFSALPP